eukprot:NODE_305_length_11349_cov_0.358222.p7 type:complete len:215 gc:universal NODE_305_length_11349_cov_0.358222:8542-7898(-)
MAFWPYRIGITGSIATGKSTAVNELKSLGCSVIDADEIAKSLYHKFHPSYYLVWFFFGSEVFDNKDVDRNKLGQLIFSNPDKRRILNLITHPFVLLSIALQYLSFLISGPKYVFFDIPLLYESNLEKYMNQVWVIYVPEDVQKIRLLSRVRGTAVHDLNRLSISELDSLSRISSQVSIEVKKDKANVVIKNTGPVVELQQRIRYLVASLEKGKS